ncbi:MAG: DUF808 domain-containing protein [Rhodobacteraceae bacterium]|nr:DUF808 domain-containing protein [Paracoccaceae bacterium]
MSSGLLALLDDVAAIAKVAAASADDIGALATKAGVKSAGLVVDDAAVTPKYVVGFSADRELPIVAKIARGSLFNKLIILLPGALILSLVAPWAITPILMLGGLFLCFEGAEKVSEWIWPHAHETGHGAGEPAEDGPHIAQAGTALEDRRVASAIKTDFILSAEIMAIALSAVPDAPFWQQGVVLALVGTGITALVYGAVALIVKADDAGLVMAKKGRFGITRAVGRVVVKAMPGFLTALKIVGTVAMLLVGAGILLHGLEVLGLPGPAHAVHGLAGLVSHGGLWGWITESGLAILVGAAVGMALIPLVEKAIVPLIDRVRTLRAG